MFKPTYLYIKTHNTTGLKYFGKTIGDPFKYKGSGTRWVNHLNYHGNDVTTEIVGHYLTEDECKVAALTFSEKNNIVDSDQWANSEPEDGLNGGFGAAGSKNSQFGSYWVTNRAQNKKIPKELPIPEGWEKGRAMPTDWGDNVRNKLKGKTQIELLGEKRAKEISELKSRLLKERHSRNN